MIAEASETPTQLRRPTARIPKLALTFPEAGAALGVSARTVEEMVKGREIPYVRVGRRIILPVDGLREWLKKHTIAPTSEAGGAA